MNWKHLRIAVLALQLACLPVTGSSAAEDAENTVFSFGVVPQQSASKLARLWSPLLDELGKRAGHTLVFKTAPDIPTFEKRLAQGEYDFAYMNPYHYTVFGDHPGYRAIGKQKDKQIRGILVVHEDSPIRSIQDLQGLTLAFPAPAAFAASVLPRSHLKAAGIHITPRYVSSHDSVYHAVARGFYPAGGGIERTLKNMNPAVAGKLRVLWKTPPYTPHAIAAHPRVQAAAVAAVQREMFRLHEDDDGRKALTALKFTGIGPARHEDWDDVRKLGIELLDPAAEAGR